MKLPALFLLLSFCLAVPILAQEASPNPSKGGEKGVTPIPHSVLATPHSTRAVVIGISDYQDKDIPDLRFADKDAEAFANFLRSPAGGSLDGDHLKLLLNSEATMAQFAAALDWLWEVSKEGDQAIIYFSGHGDVEKKSLTQPGFLLCWDAPARVYMGGGAFALPMLQEVISTLSIQNKAKVVVITDACRSGTLAGQSVGGAQATAANLAKQFANEIKILSCQPNEYSIEGEQWGGGRGAFSFHLVDALYGMADANNDLSVNLKEVGRYLEDHVSAEVDPVRQNPKVVGDPTERLASVDSNLLAALRSGKTNQMQLLSPIETKGMEEDVLAGVDTTVRELYRLFKKALKDKVFLEPATACAETYYERLIAEPKMERLHNSMRRNYAAALQDEAQQHLNQLLKSNQHLLDDIAGRRIDYIRIARQVRRAADLLGTNHYMYNTLKAKEYYFLGKHHAPEKTYAVGPDDSLFQNSREAWLEGMKYVENAPYLIYLLMHMDTPDSFAVMAARLSELAPNWVVGLHSIASGYFVRGKPQIGIDYLKKALLADSSNLRTYLFLNVFHSVMGDKSEADRMFSVYARKMTERMAIDTLPAFALDYYGLGLTLWINGQYEEAEKAYFQSTRIVSSGNLFKDGCTSIGQLRYMFLKRPLKDVTHFFRQAQTQEANDFLASIYLYEAQYDSAAQLAQAWLAETQGSLSATLRLGQAYQKQGETDAASELFQKLLTRLPAPEDEYPEYYYRIVGQLLTGRTDTLDIYIEKTRTTQPEGFAKMTATAYACARQPDVALGWLEEALNNGEYYSFMSVYCDYADVFTLADLPDFKALMKKHFPGQIPK